MFIDRSIQLDSRASGNGEHADQRHPAPSWRLELMRERRENSNELDIRVDVVLQQPNGPQDGEVRATSWLTDLPRTRRAQLLRQFRLPPLYPGAAVMAPDGVGAAKSFLHFLACEASATERSQVLKRHGGSLSELLQSQPRLRGVLVAEGSDGCTPLGAFLKAEKDDDLQGAAGADQALFRELMAAYATYAGDCFRRVDTTGLMLVMGHLAQLMPDIAKLELDMTPVWDMLDNYGVIRIGGEYAQRPTGRLSFISSLTVPEERIDSDRAKRTTRGAKAGRRWRLLLVTVPGLFDKFQGVDGVERNTPWELIVAHLPTERFSIALPRAGVDYRHHTAGLSLMPVFVVADLLAISSLLSLLYMSKDAGMPHEEGRQLQAGEIAALALLWLAVGVLLIPEVNQLRVSGLHYFWDVLNIFDVLLVASVVVVTALLAARHSWYPAALAYGIVLSWIKLIGFMRTFERTAGIVRMIGQVAKKTTKYVLVLVLLMAGFSFGNHALLSASPGSEVYKILLQQMRFMFADFGIFEFDVGELHGTYLEDAEAFPKGTMNYAIFLLINVSYIYLVGIILFNLLISVISEIYEEVRESELSALTSYRANLDIELSGIKEYLVSLARPGLGSSGGGSRNRLYIWVDPMDASWRAGADGQGQDLRPMFRRIEDVKKTLSRKLDSEVADVRRDIQKLDDDVRGVRSEFQTQVRELRDMKQRMLSELRQLRTELGSAPRPAQGASTGPAEPHAGGAAAREGAG